MSNQYLLEIGTEELPAGFLKSAPRELDEKVRGLLSEQAIDSGDVSVLATPRRLAILIDNLPEVQPARDVLLKGPPVRIGLDEKGNPTKAAEGFAKKSGIAASDLVPKEIEGESYLVFEKTVEGQPVSKILAEHLPDIILRLSGSHFMVWGDNPDSLKFSRPVRWLLSLWNDTPVPVYLGPVEAQPQTYGHRVLADNPVPVKSAASYIETLKEAGLVTVDQAARESQIWAALQASAKTMTGTVLENPELLHTVTMLVETPSVVVGHFEEKYLDLPAEVLTTVMASHQKYFPVYESDKKTLLPHFMTVSNGAEQAADNIRLGNEKVIRARFEDARFFFADDQKTSLASRVDDLRGITFQKGLGNLFDKTQRLMELSRVIADELAYSKQDVKDAQRGAELCKADLVTSMVFEFTELQGVMGQKYAALSGENDAVADSIYEHYLPRFTGDAVAKTPAGIAVSLADKIDTITAVFTLKGAKLPTGSKDPLGLRRMASGILQTVLENNLTIDLEKLFEHSYEQIARFLPDERQEDEAKARDLIREFILQRLKVRLLEDDSRYDIIDAVLASGQPLSDLSDALKRIEHLKILVQDEAPFNAIYEPANRIGRMLKDQYNPASTLADVDESLLKESAEQALFKAVQQAGFKPDDTDYAALTKSLSGLSSAITTFFDDVLVNDKDPAVKQNRYYLLSLLHTQYQRLADFSKLVV